MRVNIGEPGFEHKETIKSACKAAASGGVTQWSVCQTLIQQLINPQ